MVLVNGPGHRGEFAVASGSIPLCNGVPFTCCSILKGVRSWTLEAEKEGCFVSLLSKIVHPCLYVLKWFPMKIGATGIATVLFGSIAGVACAQSAGPTDPQIAAIVVTANQVDIDAGKLAKSRSHTKDVQDFAQLMITDHGGVNKAATALVQRLHVTPEPNATSESLQKGGNDNLATLRNLQGGSFDKAYIDHEVAYHEAVLQALDKTLIPSAQNAELKALMVKVRPVFVAHLDHAKHLQAELGSST
jgi:putative membrane protein